MPCVLRYYLFFLLLPLYLFFVGCYYFWFCRLGFSASGYFCYSCVVFVCVLCVATDTHHTHKKAPNIIHALPPPSCNSSTNQFKFKYLLNILKKKTRKRQEKEKKDN